MSEWIKVEDGLPKPYETVLVFPKPRDRHHLATHIGENNWALSVHEGGGWIHLEPHVSHWIPLPKPPKRK